VLGAQRSAFGPRKGHGFLSLRTGAQATSSQIGNPIEDSFLGDKAAGVWISPLTPTWYRG